MCHGLRRGLLHLLLHSKESSSPTPRCLLCGRLTMPPPPSRLSPGCSSFVERPSASTPTNTASDGNTRGACLRREVAQLVQGIDVVHSQSSPARMQSGGDPTKRHNDCSAILACPISVLDTLKQGLLLAARTAMHKKFCEAPDGHA